MLNRSIYHMTSFENLSSIISDWCLRAKKRVEDNNIKYNNIANQDIQDIRSEKHVPIYPYGTIHNYVPFYFGPRSPMLYSIYKGHKDYTGGQQSIVYLVSSIGKVLDQNYPFVFTDGNATSRNTNFYSDFKDLDKIDWSLIFSSNWYNTPEDPDRKHRRQAEFLVHNFFSWRQVEWLVVIDEEMADKVNTLVENLSYRPQVFVEPEWYY